MEKKLLNDLERINNLMGNKKSLYEIRVFTKIGVSEAIAEIKTVMREATEMVRSGNMKVDDFKSKLKEDIGYFKEYLPVEKYNQIIKEIDDLSDTLATQKRYNDLADQLDNQLDNLEKELNEVKRNFNVDLNKFRKELSDRTINYYKKALSGPESVNYVDELVGNLDGVNPNTGNRYIDDVVSYPANSTVDLTDRWIDNFVETFVNRRKANIDSNTSLSQRAKDTMKLKLDNTKQDIKNAIKKNEYMNQVSI